MPIVKGQGQVKHHFWGDYHASIVIAFSSPDTAKFIHALLGGKWKLMDAEPKAISWHGKDPELSEVKNQLEKYGVDLKRMFSVAKSIDYGERFTIEIPV